MQPRFCLPIVKERPSEVLEAAARGLERYAFVEVWLDYVLGVDEGFVKQLEQNFRGKLVVVFRRLNLEPMQLEPDRRQALLRALAGTHALVDLDVKIQHRELEMIAREALGVRVIGSYHNYESTPYDSLMHEVVAEIESHEPEIVKVATMCQTEADALRLLKLQLSLKQQGRKHIVLGMGAHGAVTRVFGSLWGNELIFAPEHEAGATAPGELTRDQLDTIFEQLLN